MKRLQNKTNTNPPNSTYPYGWIQDEDPNVDPGTPVDHEVYNDIHQTEERIIDWLNKNPNGLLDNADNGFENFEFLTELPSINEVKNFGRFEWIYSIGTSDLDSPWGCEVDPVRELLFVTDFASGNERAFVFNINDNTRMTSLEFPIGEHSGGMAVDGDEIYQTIMDPGTPDIILNVRDIDANNLVGQVEVWGGSETVATDHRPDCAVIGNRCYVSKGDVSDASQFATGIRVVDISDPSNPSVNSGEGFDGAVSEIYSMIEIVEEDNLLYVSIDLEGKIEVYDISDHANPTLVDTIDKNFFPAEPFFHVLGDYLLAPVANDNKVYSIRRDGDFARNQIRDLGGISTFDTERQIKSFHRSNFDDNGDKNYKIFMVDGDGKVIVLNQHLPK